MRLVTLALGLVVILVLAACGADPTPTPAPTATPTQVPPTATPTAAPVQQATATPTRPAPTATATTAPRSTWKIAAVGPYTGTTGVWGESLARGMRLYAEQVNAAGGVRAGNTTYNIEVVTCDALYSTPGGTQCAQKVVVSDGVTWIAGPIGSAECRGWQTVTEPSKAISIIPSGCWADGIISKERPGTFRYGISNREQGPVQFNYFKQKFPAAKKIAFIAVSDPTGTDSTKQLKDAITVLGFHEIVAEEYVARDTVDFNPAITRLLLKKPDVIYPVVLGDGGTALFFKQLAEQGFSGIKVGGCTDQELCNRTAGGTAPFEGAITFFADLCAPEIAYPSELAFCAAYKARYNENPPYYALSGPNVMQIMIQMAQGAGTVTDQAKAIKWYEDNSTLRTGISGNAALGGTTRYGIKRQIFTTTSTAQLKAGKLVPAGRVDDRYEP